MGDVGLVPGFERKGGEVRHPARSAPTSTKAITTPIVTGVASPVRNSAITGTPADPRAGQSRFTLQAGTDTTVKHAPGCMVRFVFNSKPRTARS
jgi:hypothetical protein